MNERIDHANEAMACLVAADGHLSAEMAVETGEYKADVLAYAQVHATLALVEQQRVSNLIALADKFDQPQAIDAILNRTPPNGDKGWVHHGVQPEIAAALGIEEVQS